MKKPQSRASQAPDIDSHKPGVPRHLAIIMDGNNRWARKRGLPGSEGHQAGEETVYRVVRHCAQNGVEVLTLFAFSSENWRRPQAEVNHLMELFLQTLGTRVDELHEQCIRVRFIGELFAFSEKLQARMQAAVERTRNNTAMTLVIAVNYGGQWDVIQAAAKLAHEVATGRRKADDIDMNAVQSVISSGDLPPVDLMIRTGGEKRISNFLLWQAAYSELYFCDDLWPDVNGVMLDNAFADYCQRQRRFGRSGDEVARPERNTADGKTDEGETAC
jgi:undecaprenyl diphosphate synthase